MLKGSFWMIALRWAIRLTGVVSTIILARLLTPKDFGVVAIAMVVIGIFEMLALTGQGLAIIRHRNPTREHYDTAWTIQALIGLGIAIAIVAAAPFIKIYFHEARSVPVMQCLALRALLGGLENIGTLDFRRDLRFDRVFGYNFYAKLISFVLTITLAVILRNYWALVAGILAGQLARTTLSYVMHPYRPRISFSKMSELLSFSMWTFASAIGGYFVSRADILAVGGVSGATSMGRYTMAKDTASSPIDELNGPMVSVLFPIMAKYQHDPNQLNHLYLRTLGWSAVIGASTAVGVAMVKSDMVSLLLGPKWLSIIPLMSWLALTEGVTTLTHSGISVLNIINLPHLGARLQWFRLALLAIGIFPIAYLTHDLVLLVEMRLAMTVLYVPLLLIVVSRNTGVRLREQLAALARPIAAGGLLALALWALNTALPFEGAMRLGLDIIVGIFVYVGSLLALWTLSGRPASAEHDLIGFLKMAQTKFLAIRARGLDAAQ